MQKRILLAVVTCTIVMTANAQIKRGAVFLGGQAGLTFLDAKANDVGFNGGKNTNVNISPAVGRAVRENLVAGFDLNYGYNKAGTSEPMQITHNYGLGFFLRKYRDLGKGFYLFGQARIGGSYQTQQYTQTNVQPVYDSRYKGYDVQLSFYPGIAYSVTRKLQLETGFNNIAFLDYSHSKQTSSGNPGSRVTNGFSLGSSLSSLSGFTLGFRFLLN